MTAGSRSEAGSVWRRWDPHVHLPGTALNDQFGSMSVAEALNVLADRTPRIEAVGVTDYLTTDAYRLAAAAAKGGSGSGLYLFPNVEVRLDIPTARGSGVNLHLLTDPSQVDGLDRFVGSLEFSWRDRTYRADAQGLTELGRDFREEPGLDSAAARREGVQQFKVTFEDLRKRFRTDAWARENCLVGVAAGSGDGTSGLQSSDGAFAARRQAIEAFAHFIFSGNPKDAEFWLGDGTLTTVQLSARYGGPKPCLHGSDAHTAEKLGVPDDERYTWLKGDADFGTFKMACLAPSTRAHVGSSAPLTGQEAGRIVRVSVTGADWFANGTVPINPGLVAVIGARGSGKTALADLIAAASGSSNLTRTPPPL